VTVLIERPKEYTVEFFFPSVAQLSPPIVEILDVNFKYPKGPSLFEGLNFGFDMSSRIVIVGPNGVGKTTLLNLMMGELEPTDGDIRRNNKLRIGKYNQHFVDRLPLGESPVDYLRRMFSDDTTYQSARNLLGKFGLEGHAHTIPMRDCSGGQKARVVFAELSLLKPHIMFLDEPTNNLDIESIDALCTAVNNFDGGVILVSHDARLIEECNCIMWVVGEKNCKPFEGGFPAYRQMLLDELAAYENDVDAKFGVKKSTEDDGPKSKWASVSDLKSKFNR